MVNFMNLALLAGTFASNILCTPAPYNRFGGNNNGWALQRCTRITEIFTMTSISNSTVTYYPTGSSRSKPPTTESAQPLFTTTSTPTASSNKATPRPTTPAGPVTSETPVFDGSNYYVDGVGSFKNKKVFTFNSSRLPDGLRASDYTVYDSYGGAPYDHKFDPANVYCDGEYLNLRVPAALNPPAAGSGQDYTISCAEIVTTQNNIKHGSVRMNAIFSKVPGTCHGMFFYLDDTQEIDIEYLTDQNSQSNNIGQSSANGDPIPLWYSNQAIGSGQKATQATGPASDDVTALHEYRIDWVEDYTAFYIDGRLQKKYTANVPTKAGSWIWNNWSNGDQGWSLGPPKEDNIMKIQKITMYYDTTSDGKSS